MKVIKFCSILALTIISFWAASNTKIICTVVNRAADIALGLLAPLLWHALQDLNDTTSWKASQRKLERGRLITGDEMVRVSFAYLYRIKVADKYFLVENGRGTKKYQPVGGVYQLKGNEKRELKNLFHVSDDNKIPIDEFSCDDYRLRLANKYLRKFVKRFDKSAEREKIDNLSREFVEELVEADIVDWSCIEYRYCGRHMTELKYGDHFQCYELFLADVVELLPSAQQKKDLEMLMAKPSRKYRFATAEEILSLGVNTTSGKLEETIADHTINILQEKEDQLMKTPDAGKTYRVTI